MVGTDGGTTAAAAGDTWGISGPGFLFGYGLLAVVVGVLSVRARRALADPPRRGSGVPDLEQHPYDVAYLHGGADLALYSVLGAMHAAGTIATAGRGLVQAAGRLTDGADPLERAVHFTAGAPTPRQRLAFHRTVDDALAAVRKRLVEAGLLLSAAQQNRIRRVGLWLFAVAVLGLARIVAGVANTRPVGYLVVAVVVVTVAAGLQLWRAPARTRLGDETLAALRARHHHLAPAMRPDWQAYGAAGAALGVGLYGTGALWASDPAFADELTVQRAAAGGGASDGGTSGGSCGATSSSCGGGSCGGGGGCGGGGCGG